MMMRKETIIKQRDAFRNGETHGKSIKALGVAVLTGLHLTEDFSEISKEFDMTPEEVRNISVITRNRWWKDSKPTIPDIDKLYYEYLRSTIEETGSTDTLHIMMCEPPNRLELTYCPVDRFIFSKSIENSCDYFRIADNFVSELSAEQLVVYAFGGNEQTEFAIGPLVASCVKYKKNLIIKFFLYPIYYRGFNKEQRYIFK